MAVEFVGVARLESPYVVEDERFPDFYPRGRHLRGFCGYLALELGLDLADIFPDWDYTGIIFRDLIPLSRCGNPYWMEKGGRLTPCERCGDIYSPGRVLRDAQGKGGRRWREVVEGRKYRFSILVLEREAEGEVEKLIRGIERLGFSVGRWRSRGYGRMRLLRWWKREVSPHMGRLLLLSPLISEKGTKKRRLLKRVGDDVERMEVRFVDPGMKFNSKGKGLFFLGKLAGLGFGEVVAEEIWQELIPVE